MRFLSFFLFSLLTNTGCHDHFTPVLHQLHWLSVQRRVDFKIACLVHQLLVTSVKSMLKTQLFSQAFSHTPTDH